MIQTIMHVLIFKAVFVRRRKIMIQIDQILPHLSLPPSFLGETNTNCLGAPQRHQHRSIQNKKDFSLCTNEKNLEKCPKLQNIS